MAVHFIIKYLVMLFVFALFFCPFDNDTFGALQKRSKSVGGNFLN